MCPKETIDTRESNDCAFKFFPAPNVPGKKSRSDSLFSISESLEHPYETIIKKAGILISHPKE